MSWTISPLLLFLWSISLYFYCQFVLAILLSLKIFCIIFCFGFCLRPILCFGPCPWHIPCYDYCHRLILCFGPCPWHIPCHDYCHRLILCFGPCPWHIPCHDYCHRLILCFGPFPWSGGRLTAILLRINILCVEFLNCFTMKFDKFDWVLHLEISQSWLISDFKMDLV